MLNNQTLNNQITSHDFNSFYYYLFQFKCKTNTISYKGVVLMKLNGLCVIDIKVCKIFVDFLKE